MKNILIATFGKNELVNISNAIELSKLNCTYVYVDSGSTDGSIEILKKFGITILNTEFTNWPNLRSVAFNFAKQNGIEWILILDADEYISPQTLNFLYTIEKNYDAYFIKINLKYCGKQLNFAGHRDRIRFCSVSKVMPMGDTYTEYFSAPRVGVIKGHCIYNEDKNSFINLISRQLKKAEMVTVNENVMNQEHGYLKKKILSYLNNHLLTRAFAYFFYHYFLRLGFLDGKVGFFYCFNFAFLYHVLYSGKINFEQND